MTRTFVPASLALVLALAGCGSTSEPIEAEKTETAAPAGEIAITPAQIEEAGIELVRPMVGGVAGAVEVTGTIESDPDAMRVVTAAIGGRVVSLAKNLGETVRAGEVLAVIESREAAQLRGDIQAARARLSLARSNLGREQRLFAERVSPEQDLIAARTAATEASIALRQAESQLSAAGTGGGALNRVALTAPISGQVVTRTATLGQTVAADAELFTVAQLSRVSVSAALPPEQAGPVRTGTAVRVSAAGRQGQGRVAFISPALDPQTRLVPLIATLDNRAGQWRVGESVSLALELPATLGRAAISVPRTALQTVDGKPAVFVRTAKGFRMVPVTTGASEGERVVVTSGLNGGEQIAAANSFTLKADLGKGEAGEED
ncbi:secretion protein HlyD [Novosphingobium sp. Rr 2-17]|uniref:efflux RND transporter periplasmic adaptor subunit n=1 Tax=Novosphingobium sp. Rr 2-17 TaxID=555793 RepID=UPI0002699F43|nr:efflux RND transporter periplasmic adaptor subunit [Novosphingobium sp. Rr 2-17]EIZ77356.1 secretion protein HlyD [Novosphingobium sp. Rr 2-17]